MTDKPCFCCAGPSVKSVTLESADGEKRSIPLCGSCGEAHDRWLLDWLQHGAATLGSGGHVKLKGEWAPPE